MKSRNIIVAIECFVKKDGKYLMLKRNSDKKILPGVWMAPGGKIESNEGLFECARREILEETGLKIKNLKVKAIGNGYLTDLDTDIFFLFIFADYAGGEVIKNPPDGKLMWFSPNEIIKLDDLLYEIKEIAPLLFDGSDKIVSYKVTYGKGNELLRFSLDN